MAIVKVLGGAGAGTPPLSRRGPAARARGARLHVLSGLPAGRLEVWEGGRGCGVSGVLRGESLELRSSAAGAGA